VTKPPRISVVTASYNQGRYIGEAIESVLAQNYPDVEHIVVDGMSSDETAPVLARFPHLRVIREPDKGHGDAINKGFRIATGDIYCFLNADDTLVPGALERVAGEIDPSRGCHIVMGRCRFIDEHGRYTGIEHPSSFESFERVLAIWKGHLIPQPAVFWTAQVWRECGPVDDTQVWLDYDLFCRFARSYRFHAVDQVFATYRLQPESKTLSVTAEQRLEECIRLSRRYWGAPLSPRYWRLSASLAAYRLNRRGRANALYLRAAERWQRGQRVRALGYAFATALAGPEVAFHAVAYPAMLRIGGKLFERTLALLGSARRPAPETAVYLDRTEPWDDGWAGPRLVVTRQAGGGEDALVIAGFAEIRHIRRPLVLSVSVDGVDCGDLRVEGRHFRFEVPLGCALAEGAHVVEARASGWWVSARVTLSRDYRPLSWRLAAEGIALRKR
jgi:glycosyltransferase involved in cell wall biosynthesis